MSKTIEIRRGLQYSLSLKGLFGRNRKPKFHVVKLCIVAEALDTRAIADMAEKALADCKAKPGCKWSIDAHLHKVEVIETEDGTRFELGGVTFRLGDDHSVLKGEV